MQSENQLKRNHQENHGLFFFLNGVNVPWGYSRFKQILCKYSTFYLNNIPHPDFPWNLENISFSVSPRNKSSQDQWRSQFETQLEDGLKMIYMKMQFSKKKKNLSRRNEDFLTFITNSLVLLFLIWIDFVKWHVDLLKCWKVIMFSQNWSFQVL